jgi:hypothetical protein
MGIVKPKSGVEGSVGRETSWHWFRNGHWVILGLR